MSLTESTSSSPRLRAAATPPFSCRNTLSCNGSVNVSLVLRHALGSGEPSSTTITSTTQPSGMCCDLIESNARARIPGSR